MGLSLDLQFLGLKPKYWAIFGLDLRVVSDGKGEPKLLQLLSRET